MIPSRSSFDLFAFGAGCFTPRSSFLVREARWRNTHHRIELSLRTHSGTGSLARCWRTVFAFCHSESHGPLSLPQSTEAVHQSVLEGNSSHSLVDSGDWCDLRTLYLRLLWPFLLSNLRTRFELEVEGMHWMHLWLPWLGDQSCWTCYWCLLGWECRSSSWWSPPRPRSPWSFSISRIVWLESRCQSVAFLSHSWRRPGTVCQRMLESNMLVHLWPRELVSKICHWAVQRGSHPLLAALEHLGVSFLTQGPNRWQAGLESSLSSWLILLLCVWGLLPGSSPLDMRSHRPPDLEHRSSSWWFWIPRGWSRAARLPSGSHSPTLAARAGKRACDSRWGCHFCLTDRSCCNTCSFVYSNG